MKYFRKDSSRKYCPKPRRDSEDFLSSPCVSDCRSGYQWSLLLRFLNQSGKCPWLEEVLNPKVFALNYYFMSFYCGLYHLIWKCCGDVITTTVEIKNQKMLKIENGKLFKIISSRPRIMQLGDEIPPNHPARALFISPLHDWKAVNLSCAMPYWLTSNSRFYVWVCVPMDRWIRLAWRSFEKGRI